MLHASSRDKADPPVVIDGRMIHRSDELARAAEPTGLCAERGQAESNNVRKSWWMGEACYCNVMNLVIGESHPKAAFPTRPESICIHHVKFHCGSWECRDLKRDNAVRLADYVSHFEPARVGSRPAGRSCVALVGRTGRWCDPSGRRSDLGATDTAVEGTCRFHSRSSATDGLCTAPLLPGILRWRPRRRSRPEQPRPPMQTRRSTSQRRCYAGLWAPPCPPRCAVLAAPGAPPRPPRSSRPDPACPIRQRLWCHPVHRPQTPCPSRRCHPDRCPTARGARWCSHAPSSCCRSPTKTGFLRLKAGVDQISAPPIAPARGVPTQRVPDLVDCCSHPAAA
jgi:hypothetical protein